MARIEYLSEGFPSGGPVANGSADLNTTWSHLLWAAITVGRPNRQYVFQHGRASRYEAYFRLSLMRMTLEQRSPTAYRLRRTTAARTLDPTEKGAVNYFLGLTICKLFSADLLNTPWLLHLDVFRQKLNVVLTGRSRPDLIGQTPSGSWIAVESKGRVTSPDSSTRMKAKQQALRLVSIMGQRPSYMIGAVTYFRNDVLEFFWRDPAPEDAEPANPIEDIAVNDEDWEHYYRPVLDLIHSQPESFKHMTAEPVLARFEDMDIQIGVMPDVLTLLVEGRWGEAKRWCMNNHARLEQEEYQADGIRVVAGDSWLKPFEESEEGADEA